MFDNYNKLITDTKQKPKKKKSTMKFFIKPTYKKKAK